MGKLAVSFLVATALVTRVAWGADDPFVGAWKLDPSKSRLTDQMKVESLGPNKYAFDFGGGPETIVTDGTDQPGYGGTLLAVTLHGPDSLNVTRKQNGKRMLSADWNLSQDGKILTDHFTSFGPDGAAAESDLVYARVAGTSGFAGTWERPNTVDSFVLKIQPDEAGGLALSYLGKTKDMRFDGKDHSPVGAGVLPGLTFSAQRTSRTGLEVTDKFQGSLFDTQEITLSSDLKTLTMTIHKPGRHSPDVLVFERQ